MLLIPSIKKKTKESPIESVSDPADFYLPLGGYRDDMEPIVAFGERVLKYQCIAQSAGVFSTRLHAPASGLIKEIVTINGKQHIHLENDFKEDEISVAPVDVEKLTPQRFAEILAQSGIEGAGGSRFPTQMKYRVKEGDIKTLIFNGVECEPYLSADAVLMKEKAFELVKTAQTIGTILKAGRVVFVLEAQNKDISKIVKEVARKQGYKVEFCIVPDTYPQGGELQVIKSVTGLELKKGEIPSAHGILVNNVGTLWAIHQTLFEGKPHIERVLTVSGNKSEKQGNYQAKIGTPVSHFLTETQKNQGYNNNLIVLGGAMMGKAVDAANGVVNKGSGGILTLKKHKDNSYNCIKCGDCVTVCPQRLMPLEFVRHASNGDTDALKQFNLHSCIECGACAYVCPSNVPLMDSIFKGKELLS